VTSAVRLRTIIVLSALAALLGGGYYLFDVRGGAEREQARLAERRVVSFDPARVREITIEKPGERIVVRRDGSRWGILNPAAEGADEAVVEGLLDFIRRLEKVRSLDGISDLRAVGLETPAVRLILGLDSGETLTLALGGPNPVRTGVYAAVEGAPLVFLAPARLATELGKTPYLDQLRDKTILPVEIERVRRVEIARHATRVAVVRLGERQWEVERPFRAPGDDGIIRDLLWKIGSSRAHEVIRAPGPPSAYGLDRPHARLTIVDDRGGSRTLAVAQAPDAAHVLYARVEGVPVVHVTDTQLLADLAIEPQVLRNRQLLVYDQRDVERITIRYPRQTLVLDRAGDGWRVTAPLEGEAARSTVDNILEVLVNLRYATVEPGPPGDLQRYGLDPPRLAVTVGLRGGRELPMLAVGREERGAHFVMVGNRAPVYTVDARLIRVIPADPTDAKRYPLPEQLKRDVEKARGSRS
jgi:Domain of unknown function (DUF4340)